MQIIDDYSHQSTTRAIQMVAAVSDRRNTVVMLQPCECCLYPQSVGESYQGQADSAANNHVAI